MLVTPINVCTSLVKSIEAESSHNRLLIITYLSGCIGARDKALKRIRSKHAVLIP